MNGKWGKRCFTAGSVFLLLLGLVHSLSLIKRLVPANATEKQLLDLMTGYQFNLLGSMRSMDNLLRGFSISFTLGMLAMGGVCLVLRRERAGLLKRVALVNVIWLAAMNAVTLRYFFAVPTAFLAAGLILFVLAWAMLPAEG